MRSVSFEPDRPLDADGMPSCGTGRPGRQPL